MLFAKRKHGFYKSETQSDVAADRKQDLAKLMR